MKIVMNGIDMIGVGLLLVRFAMEMILILIRNPIESKISRTGVAAVILESRYENQSCKVG